jgi:hypothetical protein
MWLSEMLMLESQHTLKKLALLHVDDRDGDVLGSPVTEDRGTELTLVHVVNGYGHGKIR